MPKFSSAYNTGYIPCLEIDSLRAAKVVGDTCRMLFDIHVNPDGFKLQDRLMTIESQALLSIPTPIDVASGTQNPRATLGAVRVRYIKILVTDN